MADDIGIQQEMLIEPTHKKLEIVDGHAVKDVEDYQNPELLYKSLIERVRKYHPSADVSMIEKAYHIARNAHKGQTRKSGEEYIIHPLWVGIILAQLEMDKETIVAGILHDVVEDTVMTDEEIRQEFGDEVALLVDGVTKLGQLSYSADKLEVQAENLRKMFLAMAKDIRVIIIKLADRLHNMRTLQYMRPEKQLEKAKETMDIYAPIAQRLGISKIKTELDDLALKYSQPEVFNDLVKQINARKTEREEFVQQIVDEVSTHMKNANIDAEVNGRVKHFFSIYKKMVNQDKTVDQIYDLFAVRIIVDSVKDCYAALGVIHEMYTPVPGRFKDYIAMPKANMYQSLHTTLMGPAGQPFEIRGIFFYQKVERAEWYDCSERGMEAMVIDFGALTQKNQDAFFRCSRCFLVGSVSGWQLADFAALAAEKQKWKKWCEYFVSFGEEEAVKMVEQYLDIRIRRIPLQKNALMVTGESMTFFGKFLR